MNVHSNENIFPALPIEILEQNKTRIAAELEKRWEKVRILKPYFSSFSKKSDEKIDLEYSALHELRLHLWYRNPDKSPHISQMDYMASQPLLEKGYYRMANNIAFDFNNTDPSYNASTILLNHHYFIALQEPSEKILPLFFKLLINHHASTLVRVKAIHEYKDEYSVKYWENALIVGSHHTELEMNIHHSGKSMVPCRIPYFHTDNWTDDKGFEILDLYNLVSQVRKTYHSLNKKGPIACHCASGVGRTGTFMAAYIIAETIAENKQSDKNLDNFSIEKIVLKLSIQRPNMVANIDQYKTLYRFAEYCLLQEDL